MAFLPQDTIEVNRPGTAVRLIAPSGGIGDFSGLFPTHIAVQGDAKNVALTVAKQQNGDLYRKFLRNIAIVLGIQLLILLLFMIQNQDFNLASYAHPWLWFMAVLTFLIPCGTTFADAKVDGLEINAVTYTYLTPQDRDSLFLAHTRGKDIYDATLLLLTEKYAKQESVTHQARLDLNRKKASTLLGQAHLALTELKKEP